MFLFFLFFSSFKPAASRRDYFLHILLWFFYPCTVSPAGLHTGTTTESLMALDSKLTPALTVAAPAGRAPLTRLGPCSAAARVISKLWLIRLMEGSGGGDKNQGNHWVMEDGDVGWRRSGREVFRIAGNLFGPLRERHQELLKMASSAKKRSTFGWTDLWTLQCQGGGVSQTGDSIVPEGSIRRSRSTVSCQRLCKQYKNNRIFLIWLYYYQYWYWLPIMMVLNTPVVYIVIISDIDRMIFAPVWFLIITLIEFNSRVQFHFIIHMYFFSDSLLLIVGGCVSLKVCGCYAYIAV